MRPITHKQQAVIHCMHQLTYDVIIDSYLSKYERDTHVMNVVDCYVHGFRKATHPEYELG